MKIPFVGNELLHSDGQTDRHDMTKLIFAFQNFANAPKSTMKFIHQFSALEAGLAGT